MLKESNGTKGVKFHLKGVKFHPKEGKLHPKGVNLHTRSQIMLLAYDPFQGVILDLGDHTPKGVI